MKPLITCIIPAHNSEAFLAQTIRSVLAQSWRPIEVLVVDDGSIDRTVEIALAFGPPVRVVSHAVSHPVLNRNHGISSATGTFIGFVDHDDLCAPDRLTLQMAAFDADPALDICVGMVQRFSRPGFDGPMTMIGPPVPGYLTITMLARREVFEKVGLLDPAQYYANSAEWFLRARERGLKIALLSETLTYHRDHESNLSLIHGDRSRKEFMHLIKAKLDRERCRR